MQEKFQSRNTPSRGTNGRAWKIEAGELGRPQAVLPGLCGAAWELLSTQQKGAASNLEDVGKDMDVRRASRGMLKCK